MQIKRVEALRGRLQKKCKIKTVGALRGGLKVDWGKKCKTKWVGALRGGWRVDCKKNAKLRGLDH